MTIRSGAREWIRTSTPARVRLPISPPGHSKPQNYLSSSKRFSRPCHTIIIRVSFSLYFGYQLSEAHCVVLFERLVNPRIISEIFDIVVRFNLRAAFPPQNSSANFGHARIVVLKVLNNLLQVSPESTKSSTNSTLPLRESGRLEAMYLPMSKLP